MNFGYFQARASLNCLNGARTRLFDQEVTTWNPYLNLSGWTAF
jgi:hypothetical protein